MNENTDLAPFFEAVQSGEVSFEQAILAGIQLARAKGFEEGFEKGTIVGYCLAMEQMKPVISDGLRSGSSECGKAMRARVNQGDTA